MIPVCVLVSACTESAWIAEVPLEACVQEAETPSEAELDPLACSCPTSTATETWTVSESWTGACSLSGPANPMCDATAVLGGYLLTCEYPSSAPACASLKFLRPTGHNDLVGLEVDTPVCSSTPASPSTGSKVSAKIKIPSAGASALRADWDAWGTAGGGQTCSIGILTSQEGQTRKLGASQPD